MSVPYTPPADGTQPQYQYVTPQQPGSPAPAQYVQPSPQPVYVDPNQQAFSPQPVYADPNQQAFSPQPVYADPNQQQQQAYYAQPQAQPTYVVTSTEQTTSLPVVTGGNGKGIVGKMPQLDLCCFFLPLHTGALVIAFLMTIYYGYCGIVLLAGGTFTGGVAIGLIILGILYLLVAIVSGYGFVGIYKEQPLWIDRFIRMYLVGSIMWLVLEFIYMIIVVATYSQYYWYSFPWASWIIQIIICGGLQYYFCICLVSYQRVLHARVDGGEKIAMA
ncbi:hypothetical protein BGZ80_009312 [Entomortierella chlamydospora]|uniref:Uncharacterized protein n=1 Tax=Entomortierella chlamydospora TaxID=101097 RepID=A0A9P6T0T6_9FUNG|nr:hypothetical protein BGZ79_007713 [Entomortierella chlamydospora]KAG0016290.1 hypothetical protein BGZ80_009312 [Entomortierella chlamydospora]